MRTTRPSVILALVGALTAACGQGRVPRERCGDGVDNDGDGKVDCADRDCVGVVFEGPGGVELTCPEVCDDGRDNDGDTLIDCADPACDGECPEECWDARDNDGDGGVDCADSDCVPDCDADADGYLDGARGGDDCDDSDPSAHPGGTEVCGGGDEDCDGLVDEEDGSLNRYTLIQQYPDADGDGFGVGDFVEACVLLPGYGPAGGDCDDSAPELSPGAIEVCNGIDDDCDERIDLDDPSVDTAYPTWCLDWDQDGYGDPGAQVVACHRPAFGTADCSDCDDADPTIGAPGDWLLDLDGDGYGSGAAVGPFGCVPPGPEHSSTTAAPDCDDSDPAVNPGAGDACGDGIDTDCDGLDCREIVVPFTDAVPAEWRNDLIYPWNTQRTDLLSPLYGLDSGMPPAPWRSDLSFVATFEPGATVGFWIDRSRPQWTSPIQLLIDEQIEVELYEVVPWDWVEVAIPPGEHEFRWRDLNRNQSPSATLDDVVIRGARYLVHACGNGWRESGETCDDGNAVDGDGCSAACQVEGTQPSAPGDVVFSELMVDGYWPWFELYNPTATPWNLMGCRAWDDSGFVEVEFPEPLYLGPGGRVSVSYYEFPESGFESDIAWPAWGFGANADGMLLECGGADVDEVNWVAAAGWPIVPWASMQLDPGALDSVANDDPSSWCPATFATPNYAKEYAVGEYEVGSPGLPNEPCP